jgi:hypothetical protein
MSVCVDKLNPCITSKAWPYQRACHLIADSVEELIGFAQNIGLKKEWLQDKNTPHFDLNEAKRKQAIANGAIALPVREFVLKMRNVKKGEKWHI